jgi:hypothetical protein
METSDTRALHEIYDEIRSIWRRDRVNLPAAAPYLDAFRYLGTTIHGRYGYDTAEGIVLRFLGNARSWRGEDARRIKAELRAILKKGGA